MEHPLRDNDWVFARAEQLALLATENPDDFLDDYKTFCRVVSNIEGGWTVTHKLRQRDLILEYLRGHDYITPREALDVFGVFRLAARISDLRADGYHIVTEEKALGRKRFAAYRLIVDA